LSKKYFHNGDLPEIKRCSFTGRIQKYQFLLVKIAPKKSLAKKFLKPDFRALLGGKNA
jgi:hypothetical protein